VNRVTITWRVERNLYVATEGNGVVYQGASPDEAVGYLVREALLSGRTPFCIVAINGPEN
jgi:hypothetical protein